ncbi:DUF4168 domain-containing protein [Cellvibrio sp. ARAG 10.3]|uniref:DUF4168 domain-containing protein n=1 Tax=Cellvibrio sp. ARAG 10.3 TaxID=3451358 RepID=UPI003F470F0A
MFKMIKQPLAILSISVGLCAAPLALAETVPQTTTPTAPATQAQPQISEEKVDQFVTAYVEVQKINQEYSEQLQATEAPEKATELQQEAQTKMQEAVADSGLTIPEYQQIASRAGQDQDLRARIQEKMAN